MRTRLFQAALAAGVALAADGAAAHPHVFISVESRVVFAQDGAARSLRFTWAYDPAYTAFAFQQLELPMSPGVPPYDALARSQMAALKRAAYLADIELNGSRIQPGEAVDLEATAGAAGGLVMSFSLPLATTEPVKRLTVEILDPTFLAYFTVPSRGAVSMASAPAGCVAEATGPAPLDLKHPASIPRAFWAALDGKSDPKSFATRMTLTCP